MAAESRYISGEYARRHPTYHVEDSAWKVQRILSMIRHHDLRPRSICEVGCGAGENLRQLQLSLPDEVRFDGYEISPQAYALCRERENDRLHFHCADFVGTPTAPFDLLLCIDVVEHVEDYIGFLRALRLRAKHKIFHIPLDMSVQSVLRCRPILESRRRLGHLHCFMKETALAALADTGYEVIEWTYTPVGLIATRFKARIAWLPRRLLLLVHQGLAVRLLGGHSLLVLAR
jgi:hypothetical protein